MARHVGQDLTVYYNGTQITGTSGTVTRTLTRTPSFSPFTWSPEADYVGATDVLAESGEPTVEAMQTTLYIRHAVAGAASATVVERTLMDEMRAYQEIINPFDGAVSLRVDRSTAAAAAVSSEVYKVRAVSVPRFSIELMPDELGTVGPTSGVMFSEWELWCPLPYFYDRTATTLAYVADDPADSDTMANGGIAPCGARFAVTGITGSPTQVTITNSTNSYAFVWKKTSGNFADGDYIDWYYTDPRQVDVDSDTTIVSADGLSYFELACGNNTVTALRSAGTGTVSITASWKPRYLSL